MKRIFLAVIVLLNISICLKAQWSGSMLDGDTYRNGNVGIGGTADSNAKLLIQSSTIPRALYIKTEGESSTWRDQIFMFSNLNTGYGIAFGGQGHHRAGMFAENYGGTSSSVGQLTLWTRSGGNILLDAGKVGIGTTTPYYKLDVEGTIRAHEIKVNLDEGADFVFEEDYNLMPLNDLETFVKTQKHLPEVAPAKEMEAEGLNISEMNIKLLQKIEELTLYVIAQQKQVDELVNEIEELKSNSK